MDIKQIIRKSVAALPTKCHYGTHSWENFYKPKGAGERNEKGWVITPNLITSPSVLTSEDICKYCHERRTQESN